MIHRNLWFALLIGTLNSDYIFGEISIVHEYNYQKHNQ